MNPEEKNVEEVLKQYWSSASQEEAETACNRVLYHLKVSAEHAPLERRAGIGSFSFFGKRVAMVSVAAAALFAVVIGTTMVQRHRAFAVVEKSGAAVAAGEIVPADGDGSTLVLADGSRVEMRAQSELALERAGDGVRIRLNKGDVIVSAARQRGHLYVQTKDVSVSVVGTVFLVKAEPEGSRVAVIQGEVRVQQQGVTEKSLLPGEQVQTNPNMESHPVSEEISWSNSAPAHIALLQQLAAAPQASKAPPPNPPVRETFEVATVKVVDAGPRGARGDIPYPCNGSGPQIDPGRFYVGYIALNRLIAWAYGRDCGTVERNGLLSGGPSWMRTTPFEVQAAIPAGSPSYTVQQFLNGNAPTLQKMLQNLLAERFKLGMHSETKEVPVYNLVKLQDTGRLKASDDQTPIDSGALPDPLTRRGRLVFTPSPAGLTIVSGSAVSISALLEWFRFMLDRSVVDKTDLKGLYDISPFQLTAETAAVPAGTPAPPPGAVSSSQVPQILEQLGLKLENSRAPMEVQVIDHVEKPLEN